MPRLTLTRAEWLAVANKLAEPRQTTAPPGVEERVRALLRQVPGDWPDQPSTLELDEGSADAVRGALAAITGHDPADGQRAASVLEANEIIRDHQRDSE